MRCEVFDAFDSGDIDLGRTKRDRRRVLERSLDFAKTGELDRTSTTGRDADSPFEEDLAAVIRGLGFYPLHQVGPAGIHIDLGVRHLEQPCHSLASVGCDGAPHHSAIWAREGDRMLLDILEGYGWTFRRVLSPIGPTAARMRSPN